jgi:hypothetical protein
MPAQLPSDSEAFLHFLTEQMRNGGNTQSPEELLRVWRTEHAAAIEDIRDGIQNMEAGLGRPLEEADAEIREKHNIPETP